MARFITEKDTAVAKARRTPIGQAYRPEPSPARRPSRPVGATQPCQNAGVPPLSPSVDPAILLFLAAVFLFGSIINGMIGFGLAPVAVTLSASVIDGTTVVVTRSVIARCLSSSQRRHNWSLFHSWSRLRSLTLGAIV